MLSNDLHKLFDTPSSHEVGESASDILYKILFPCLLVLAPTDRGGEEIDPGRRTGGAVDHRARKAKHVAQLAKNSFEGSFLSDAEKKKWIGEVEKISSKMGSI